MKEEPKATSFFSKLRRRSRRAVKGIKSLFRRGPAQGPHGEIVVFSVPNLKLTFEVEEREKRVDRIEILVVFAVTALNLTVMPGSKRSN